MKDRYLYTTAVPVLLGGGRLAGKTALYLYAHYGLAVRWLGDTWHPLLAIYAKRLASLPLTEENDATVTRHLLAFAESYRRSVGIPAVIPCSPEAEAYLTRAGDTLEEEFVLLPLPDLTQNPLRGLLRREDTP
jgi:hypothetical protein